MKTILVPISPGDNLSSILETSFLLAQKFGAHVEGMARRTSTFDAILRSDPHTAADQLPHLTEAEEVSAFKAKDYFENFFVSRIPVASQPPGTWSYHWSNDMTEGDDIFTSVGRTADAIVLGRSSHFSARHLSYRLNIALAKSGRPVFLAPPSAPRRMGERVLIAWDGSVEHARAISFGLPLLGQAGDVVILALRDKRNETSPEALRQSLCRHGIDADVIVADIKSSEKSETILYHANRTAFDLLIIGAYFERALAGMRFGSATRKILERARIPVLVAC